MVQQSVVLQFENVGLLYFFILFILDEFGDDFDHVEVSGVGVLESAVLKHSAVLALDTAIFIHKFPHAEEVVL